MARVTSKASLSEGTEYAVSLAGKTVTVNAAGNISSGAANGVSGLALLSSIADYWKSNATANRYRYPFYIVDGPIGSMLEMRDGWEFAGTSSIALIRDMGFAYKNAAGTITAEYACFVQGGTLADAADQPYYMIGSDTTPTDFGVADAFNECIQVYGDATHGNFDKRSAAKLFSREAGKTYAGYDLVATQNLSALTYRSYLIPMTTVADSGISVTGPSGAPYSGMTLTLGATTNTINSTVYNFAEGEIDANGGTVQQVYDWFQDLLLSTGDIDSGAGTQRGDIYLGASLTFSGGILTTSQGLTIKNIVGTDTSNIIHVDDTGTPRQQAVSANWSGSNLPDDIGGNTLLQISNLSAVNATLWATGQTITAGDIRLRSIGTGSESTAGLYFRAENGGTTHATIEPTWDTTPGNTTPDNGITWRCYKILFYDADPAATSASGSYTDGEDFAAGEQATIAFYHQNADVSFESGTTVAAVAASGFSFDASNFVSADSVYASNAIDGSTRTEFTADYAVAGTVEVDVSSDVDSSPENAYAWYCYSLTTSAGAWLFAGAITAIDEGNYRNNTAVASVKFDNTTTGSVSLQGTGSRFFRDDGANPEKIPTTSGFGVSISWELPVYLKTQTLSGSNVITGDIADLNDPSVAEIVAGIEGGTMAGRVTSILTDTADMQPRVVSIESITDLLTLAGITSAVWSAQPSSYTTNNTMGKVIKGIQEGWLSAEGEVSDGAPSTTQFVTTLPSVVDDFYAGNPLTFTNGSLAGQSRVITAYNGTTKQVTLDHALTGAPANGDSFNVLADHIHTIDEIQSGLATSAELVDPAARIAELWRLLGLDAAEPVTISSTGHAGTSVSITITDNGDGSVTLQRV